MEQSQTDKDEQRGQLGHGKEGGESPTHLGSANIDQSQSNQNPHRNENVVGSLRDFRDEVPQHQGEAAGQGGPRYDGHTAKHPTHLEADKRAEGVTSVGVGAPGGLESAADLGEAKRDQKGQQSRAQQTHQASGSHETRSLAWLEEDALSNDRIDPQSDHIEQSETSLELGLLASLTHEITRVG